MSFRSGIVVQGEPAKKATITVTMNEDVAQAVLNSITIKDALTLDFVSAIEGEIGRLYNLENRTPTNV